MPDTVLLDGDLALFVPVFAAAIVVVRPGTLIGSGPATVSKRPMCVQGDESKVQVPGCSYITPAYPIPGVGTLKILALSPTQIAMKTRTGNKPVLLRGAQFQAIFEISVPAQQPHPPGPPTPDPAPSYSGSGSFQSTNILFRGT
jgi:hypothetical protein